MGITLPLSAGFPNEAGPVQVGGRAGWSARTVSGFGAAPGLRDFRALAVLHCPADAAIAKAVADRLNGVCATFVAQVAGRAAPPAALGSQVAVVAVWSAQAAADGAAAVIGSMLSPGRVSVIATIDSTPVPGSLNATLRVGPSDDAVVVSALVYDAVASVKKAATDAAIAVDISPKDASRSSFVGGIAASAAVFGLAGVSGHVFLPAVSSDGRLPVQGFAKADTARIAENAYAADTALRTSFANVADAGGSSESIVAARFGVELRVAFQAAPQPVAPIARPLPVASATTPALTYAQSTVDAVSASGPVSPIATVDGSEAVFGAPVFTSDLAGMAPAFITDFQSEEPIER